MPANVNENVDVQVIDEHNLSSCGSDSGGLSSDDDIDFNTGKQKFFKMHSNNEILSDNNNKSDNINSYSNKRLESLPVKSLHENFLKECFNEILNTAVFNGTERKNPVLNWQEPNELLKQFNMTLNNEPDTHEKLMDLIRMTIKHSVKTGHPYFVNQLFSAVDPYGFVGQLLTDALNPSVYTYEVSPVFTLMEEVVLREMRKIVGFPNEGEGDGIFCPGGSIANGYAISCARYWAMPDIKKTGLHSVPRLVVFTSEDAHYSIKKLASFMGIGSDNVYLIDTDDVGKMKLNDLEEKILKAKSEGAQPFMVSATGGTTVLGAFDPLDGIADLCEKYKLWFHVDAAWGGGVLMSQKYRRLLNGIERADSVTWNPHKLLTAPQQCSTFLLRHKGVLSECHSTNATYLFQKDKFYDTQYDTGDKHIQCGRRADVLKFWFMWRAKGSSGFEAHIDKIFENAEYFTDMIKARPGFEMVLDEPECTNICFWYVPPSLRAIDQNTVEFTDRLHKVAPKIKERMMKEGTMMMTYQPLKSKPNFFRLVLQNSALDKNDMVYIMNEIERLGQDL